MTQERLATLRHRGIKADESRYDRREPVRGSRGARNDISSALEQAMQRYDFLTQQIDDCEA